MQAKSASKPRITVLNEKLGEGAQGCVLRGTLMQSMNEKGTIITPAGEVTKLILDKNTYENEINKTKIANDIDRKYNATYSMEILSHSHLGYDDIQHILNVNHRVLEKIKLCKNILREINSIQDIYLIVYRYEGISLFDLNLPVQQMQRLCYNLYEALKVYNKIGFLHFDIKYDNILYIKKENEGKLVFIDFGLSTTSKDASLSQASYLADDQLYKHYILYEPPELIAYAIVKRAREQNIPMESAFKMFVERYEHNLISLRQTSYARNLSYKEFIIYNLYNGITENYTNALKSLFEYVYKLKDIKLETIMKKQIRYIDAYKLSMTMLDIFEQYTSREEKLIISSLYTNVVFKGLYINPSDRYSIGKLCEEYKKLLSHP